MEFPEDNAWAAIAESHPVVPPPLRRIDTRRATDRAVTRLNAVKNSADVGADLRLKAASLRAGAILKNQTDFVPLPARHSVTRAADNCSIFSQHYHAMGISLANISQGYAYHVITALHGYGPILPAIKQTHPNAFVSAKNGPDIAARRCDVRRPDAIPYR